MNIKPLFNKDENITLNEYLHRCGVDSPEEYINPKANVIEPVSHYDSIDKAVLLLRDAIVDDKEIVIICDSDCDGYCSSAIAYQFLIDQGVPNEAIRVLFHESKQHGLSKDIITQLNEICLNNVCLVWIPDAGTNDTEQCAYLNQRGISVLITDHHMAEGENEWATIVNNQTSDNVTNKALCGTGVTHKVVTEYCKRNNSTFHQKVLDLVALASIGDVVDVRSLENRMIIKWGLEHITNPFLRAMCGEFISNGDITPTSLAWNVVPKFNAICRGTNQELKEDMFSALVGKSIDFTKVISDVKTEYRQQKKIVDDFYNKALEIKPIGDKVKIFEFENTPYTGLIATKLADHFASPCMVVHRHNNGTFSGSLRSPYDLKTKLSESGLMTLCQGHECACGVGWMANDTDKLSTYCSQLDLQPSANMVMLTTNTTLLSNDLFTLYDEGKGLWGQGIPEPTIHFSDITISGKDIKELGANKTTIKWVYGDITFIKFFCSKELKTLTKIGCDGIIHIEVIGKPTINEFRGNKTKQIIIDKIEVK